MNSGTLGRGLRFARSLPRSTDANVRMHDVAQETIAVIKAQGRPLTCEFGPVQPLPDAIAQSPPVRPKPAPLTPPAMPAMTPKPWDAPLKSDDHAGPPQPASADFGFGNDAALAQTGAFHGVRDSIMHKPTEAFVEDWPDDGGDSSAVSFETEEPMYERTHAQPADNQVSEPPVAIRHRRGSHEAEPAVSQPGPVEQLQYLRKQQAESQLHAYLQATLRDSYTDATGAAVVLAFKLALYEPSGWVTELQEMKAEGIVSTQAAPQLNFQGCA